MTTIREAAQRALETIERRGGYLKWSEFVKVREDLRAALAEPQTINHFFGSTDAFASMLTDVSRKFRYFVIEEENGGVRIKFTNTNPEQEQPR
jgi:hypothetical protein